MVNVTGYRDPFAGVPQVDVRLAYDRMLTGETELLDVREPDEWELGHIDGVDWIPLGLLPQHWQGLDAEKKWIIVCRRGNRSNYAAAFLREQGFDAANMSGGMLAWQLARLPITPPGIVEAH